MIKKIVIAIIIIIVLAIVCNDTNLMNYQQEEHRRLQKINEQV